MAGSRLAWAGLSSPTRRGTGQAAGSGEALRPTSPSRAAVVDVGGERGALVVWTSAVHEGVEVELYPDGRPDERTHCWVLPRQVADGVRHAALFPSLEAGTWVLLDAQGRECRRAEVHRGKVSEVHWP